MQPPSDLLKSLLLSQLASFCRFADATARLWKALRAEKSHFRAAFEKAELFGLASFGPKWRRGEPRIDPSPAFRCAPCGLLKTGSEVFRGPFEKVELFDLGSFCQNGRLRAVASQALNLALTRRSPDGAAA